MLETMGADLLQWLSSIGSLAENGGRQTSPNTICTNSRCVDELGRTGELWSLGKACTTDRKDCPEPAMTGYNNRKLTKSTD